MTQPEPITLNLPDPCLVVLVGASSAGKSSFAARHFARTEVLSSDFFRGLVCNDENALDANADTFDSLLFVAGKRLARGLLTVIDATSVRPESRRTLVQLARDHDLPAVAIILNLPPAELQQRHAARPDRPFAAQVVAQQAQQLRRSLTGITKEGFRQAWTLRSAEEVARVQITRSPLPVSRTDLHGPFDLIGDVHGCLDELHELLGKLGYTGLDDHTPQHPQGRVAVFVGDLTDRGPDSAGVLQLVMKMVAAGSALLVPGNHDDKLLRALQGKAVSGKHGLDGTLAQLDARGEDFKAAVRDFLAGLHSHLLLDGGKLVVAHAGLPQRYQGRSSGRVRSFALYGDVDGSLDEHGLPLRRDWAASYSGAARVVYGHTPVARPQWVNRTLNIDTGCAFGGALSALRYPEMEVLSVPARAQYAVPSRPFLENSDERLDWQKLSQNISLDTPRGPVRLRESERRAALESYARYGVDPRWCLYLPPTMSPVESSARPDHLEYPSEAFAYYRAQGLETVICQEKHMGSRAVMLLARNAEAAQRQFGAEGLGRIYSRTGRAFFTDPTWERDILSRAQAAANAAGLWDSLNADWLLLDAEILPWSLKATELIREQYAAVAASGLAALAGAVQALEQGGQPTAHFAARLDALERYRQVYRAYTRRVAGPQDIQIRPFHLLASGGAAGGQVHSDQTHLWHLQTLEGLAQADPVLFGRTEYRLVNLHDPASEQAATEWWERLTQFEGEGLGEGMVVKPLDFLPPARVQSALKVRGREYLRLIYGPEYLLPENLERLRSRALKAKRSRALREFALGLEGLRRAAEGEGVARIHECVLGVLALESEPLDARL